MGRGGQPEAVGAPERRESNRPDLEIWSRLKGDRWLLEDEYAAADHLGISTHLLQLSEDVETWIVLELRQDDELDMLGNGISLDELLERAPACLRPWIGTKLSAVLSTREEYRAEVAYEDGVDPDQVEIPDYEFLWEDVLEKAKQFPGLEIEWNPDEFQSFDVDGLEQLLERYSRESIGRELTDSERLSAVANGLTHAAWRNSPLENNHAEDPALSDEVMMAGNAATARALREVLDEGWDWDAAHRVLADPNRSMPDGRSAREWLGPEWDAYCEHLSAASRGLEERKESDYDMVWFAIKGVISTGGWYGHPSWPGRVDAFIEKAEASIGEGAPTPDGLDLVELRRQLLEGPDRVPAEWRGWCLQHGIGFVSPAE